MFAKIIIFLIPNLLILFNIKSFFGINFDNFINLVYTIVAILLLYFLVFKYSKYDEKIKENENQTFIRNALFWIMPMATIILLFVYPGSNVYNYIILLAIQCLFFMIFRNYKVAIILQLLFSFVFYVLNEVLTIVRGLPFTPIDILSLKLGTSLAGHYKFVLNSNLVRASVVVYVLVYAIFKLINSKNNKKEKKVASITGLITFLFTLCFVCVRPKFK